MAKGGLNPGADPTIVGAAIKAGLGNVPVDLSRQYKGMADAYADAMDKVGEAVKVGITTLGTVVTPLIEEAIKTNQTLDSYAPDDIHSNWTDAIWGVDGEGGWLDELKNKRKELRELPWGSEERKKLRREWNREKDRLFGMIEALEEGNLVNVENIANGNWNEAATGAENSLMMTAILAKGAPLPEGHPYAGVYAKLDRDEEGEIELQLFDKNNNPISGLNPDGSIRYAGREIMPGTYDMSKLEERPGEEYMEGQLSYYRDQKLEEIEEIIPEYGGTRPDVDENLIERATVLRDLMMLTRNPGDGKQRVYDESSNGDWDQKTKTGDPSLSAVYDLQRLLKKLYPNHEFGTTGPNRDGMDGNWGTRTEAAYNMYLKDKRKLELDVLNEGAGAATMHESSGPGEDGKYGTDDDPPLKPVDYWIPNIAKHKQLTVSNKNIGSLIVTKDQELINNLTQIGLNEIKNGGLGLVFRENDIKRQVLEQLKTPNQLSDAMHSPIGNMEYTYAEYLSMPNKWTAEMWTTIGGLGDKIKDIDGVEGISAGDFLGDQGAANMQVLRDEMLNPYNQTSKELFTDFLVDGYRAEHKYGADTKDNKRSKRQGSPRDDQQDPPPLSYDKNYVKLPRSKSSSIFEGGGGDYLDDMTQTTFDVIGNALLTKTSFTLGSDHVFKWDSERNTWLYNDEVVKNKDTMLATIFTDGGDKPFKQGFLSDINPWYEQIPDWEGGVEAPPAEQETEEVEEVEEVYTNLDSIVDNIWEPNAPEGYGIGKNAEALSWYLKQNFGYDDRREKMIKWADKGGNIGDIKEQHIENNILYINGYYVGFSNKPLSGEYIVLWEDRLEDPDLKPETRTLIEDGELARFVEYKKWGGDSTRGRKSDKKDIQQIFDTLGLSWHLAKEVSRN